MGKTTQTILDRGANSCPCDSKKLYSQCCGPLHVGTSAAVTAEALMRSRYSAYALANTEYLLMTWHRSTRPAQLVLDPAQRWLGLKIKSKALGQSTDATGEVVFAARYKVAGRGARLEERSRFLKEAGAWFYLDGVTGEGVTNGQ